MNQNANPRHLQSFSLENNNDRDDLGKLFLTAVERGPSRNVKYDMVRSYKQNQDTQQEFHNTQQQIFGPRDETEDLFLYSFLLRHSVREEGAYRVKVGIKRAGTRMHFFSWSSPRKTKRTGAYQVATRYLLFIPKLTIAVGFLQVIAATFLLTMAVLIVLIEATFLLIIDPNVNILLRLVFTCVNLALIVHSFMLLFHVMGFSINFMVATYRPAWDFEFCVSVSLVVL